MPTELRAFVRPALPLFACRSEVLLNAPVVPLMRLCVLFDTSPLLQHVLSHVAAAMLIVGRMIAVLSRRYDLAPSKSRKKSDQRRSRGTKQDLGT